MIPWIFCNHPLCQRIKTITIINISQSIHIRQSLKFDLIFSVLKDRKGKTCQ